MRRRRAIDDVVWYDGAWDDDAKPVVATGAATGATIGNAAG